MADSSERQLFETNMPPPLERPYLDSSVFLAHIKEEKLKCPDGRTRIEITTHIFEDAEQSKYTIYTSTVTLAEVRRLKEAEKELTEAELQKIKDLFNRYMQHEWIYLIEVNREIGEKAQDIGAKYGITPLDAIHLASAIWWQCNVFLVWDKHSLTKKIPDCQIEGVYIIEPYWEGTPKMPTS